MGRVWSVEIVLATGKKATGSRGRGLGHCYQVAQRQALTTSVCPCGESVPRTQTQAFATVIELPVSSLAPKAGVLAASGAEL